MSMAIKMSMSRPGQSSQFHVYVDFNISFWKSKSGKVSEEGLHQNGWLVKILWCHVTKEERHQIFLLASLSSSLLASRSLSTFTDSLKIKIKIAICCWKILKPSPGECWRQTPIWTLTVSTLSEGCASWSQKHYKHYKWSRHLITRTLQMAPHHIWWLASKKCQPSAKWTVLMEVF